MVFKKFFTAKADTMVWSNRTAKITDEQGKVIFEQQNVLAPEGWSDNAVNIVASKYFKKFGGVLECSVKGLIERVVNTIGEWGTQFNYFSDEPSKEIFKAEITWLLANQYFCFNSPVWFNLGVPNRAQQCAACFLLGIEDTMESIYDWIGVESRVFRGGSGAGVNISPLRHKNAPLSSGGVSSGPLSFMKAADYSAGAIKSGGGTRRAAKLVCMNHDHPDIEEFIQCKMVEEKKARALIAAGFDPGLNGEAYNTVAFQNMNHSVRVSDEFMDKVIEGDTQAVNLMNLIAQCAHASGDPGLQYDDTINRYHTLLQTGRNETTNPCSEFMSSAWSSCLLASLNLIKFYKREIGFDFPVFQRAVDLITVALDIMVDGADYPDPRFKDTAHRQRQLGIGNSNLGALLMLQGIPYGSEQGRKQAASIVSVMTAESYIQSARLATEMSAFEDFQANRTSMMRVISLQVEHAISEFGANSFEADLWAKALEDGINSGYRNSTTTLEAPTGTISFMMDCDTTGIEPEVALTKYKSLSGGGQMTIVNQTVKPALENMHYARHQVNEILKHLESGESIESAPFIKVDDVPVFDCALRPRGGQRSLEPQDHLLMVAAIQPFLSMGISKTINLPSTATVDDVFGLYVEAWKLGIKSISVYRDGCKASQPLNVTKIADKPVEIPELPLRRHRLPDERKSLTHRFNIAGFEGYLTVGCYSDGSPGEMFISASKQGSTTSGLLDSVAILTSMSLQYGVPLEMLVNKMTNTRFEPAGFTQNPLIPQTTSVVDYIYRWMGQKFSAPEVVDIPITLPQITASKATWQTAPLMKAAVAFAGQTCTNCGSMMVRSGTCNSCPSCGSTSGGCS